MNNTHLLPQILPQKDSTHQRLCSVLVQLFLPLARFALRHSIRLPDLVESLKQALTIAAAEKLMDDSGNISRLSVMTGIHRKDVKRLSQGETKNFHAEDLLVRVVNQWQSDRRFLNRDKTPKNLSYGHNQSEFHTLVYSVAKELNPASVLFELERTKVIRVSENSLSLERQSYSPDDKFEYGLNLLAQDSADLIDAVSENLDHLNTIPNLHVRTSFDRIRAQELDTIRSWLMREGHALHLKARNFFSTLDQDVNPDPNYRGQYCKVVLGSFSRILKGE